MSSALQEDSLLLSHQGSQQEIWKVLLFLLHSQVTLLSQAPNLALQFQAELGLGYKTPWGYKAPLGSPPAHEAWTPSCCFCLGSHRLSAAQHACPWAPSGPPLCEGVCSEPSLHYGVFPLQI